jgi:hypothetical protein
MAFTTDRLFPRELVMTCDHCGDTIPEESRDAAELDALTLTSLSDQWDGAELEHVCPDCQSDAGLTPNYI